MPVVAALDNRPEVSQGGRHTVYENGILTIVGIEQGMPSHKTCTQTAHSARRLSRNSVKLRVIRDAIYSILERNQVFACSVGTRQLDRDVADDVINVLLSPLGP